MKLILKATWVTLLTAVLVQPLQSALAQVAASSVSATTTNAVNGASYGGYRYGANGTYLNPLGQQVILNPMVPMVWSGARPMYTGNDVFRCRIGNVYTNFWRSNSGYYYPFWARNVSYAPIVYIDPSTTNPVAKLPPPAIQVTDTMKYLDDSLKDKRVVEAQYKHLRQRALDLQRKERSMRIAQGGELDAESEAEIRRDLEGLTAEMNQHIGDKKAP